MVPPLCVTLFTQNNENLTVSDQIRLLVGLANPGPEYAKTRHNAGAWVVEELARIHNVSLKEDKKYFGLTARINVVVKSCAFWCQPPL